MYVKALSVIVHSSDLFVFTTLCISNLMTRLQMRERIEIDNLKVGTIFLYEPCIQTITGVFILFYFTFFLEYACAVPYHESPS